MIKPKHCKVIKLEVVYKKGKYFPILDLCADGALFLFQTPYTALSKSIFYHIYFIGYGDIKEGDLTIFQGNIVKITKIDNKLGYLLNDSTFIIITSKIIASTDYSLGLPIIHDSFISKYVDYNGVIDSVELLTACPDCHEQMQGQGCWDSNTCGRIPILRLTDDNEVIVIENNNKYKHIINKNKDINDVLIEMYPIWMVQGTNANDGVYDANHDARKAFYAGIEYEKEQSSNKAIEFANWLGEGYKQTTNHHWIDLGGNEEALTIEELYNLWQHTK